MEKFILKMVVNNSKGVMARIATLLARKGYNIDSVCVGNHLLEGEASIVLTINGKEDEIELAKNTLGKLVNVISISATHSNEAVEREHCLLKIEKDGRELNVLTGSGFESRVVQDTDRFLVYEIVNYPPRVSEFILHAQKNCMVIDISRSGINAI